MITFTLALVLLVVGYWVYGKYVNSLFAPDSTRKTPALTMADGVDFIPLPTWKIFMIQLWIVRVKQQQRLEMGSVFRMVHRQRLMNQKLG